MSKLTFNLIIRNFIDSVVTRLKHEPFILDNQIPLSYLCCFFIDRIIGLIYGSICFLTIKRVCMHYTAVVKCKSKLYFGKNVNISRGCYIDALSKEGIILGNNVSFGRYTHMECTGSLKYLGKGIKIGDNVGLGTHGHYGGAGGLEIGNDAIIGNYVSFHPENHNYTNLDILIRHQGTNHKGIKIGQNCWIGAKATFLDGAIIGNGCVIAAGSVVKGIFPDNCIIGGIPAKIIRYRYE